MTIENLQPISRQHSVQNAVFILEWQGELSPPTVNQVIQLEKKLKDFFPVMNLQNDMIINVAPAAGVPSNQMSLSGVAFQRLDDHGILKSQLLVNRQSCQVYVGDYSRWNVVLPLAMEYFSVVLPVILADKSLSSISLQYTDVFLWKDDPENLDIKEVIREECPYIAKNIFETETYWHSYHGFMTKMLDPVAHDRLDNVNLSLTDISGDNAVQLVANQKALLGKVIRRNTPDYMKVIEDIQAGLHQAHREIFKKVFTEAVCQKIGLV